MIGRLSTVRNKELGLERSWLPGRTAAVSSYFGDIIMLVMYEECFEDLEDSCLHSQSEIGF